MKSEQCRVQALLKDTITLLCQNSLHFTKELKIQGLLGITLDGENIFIVHIDESYVVGNEKSGFSEISNSDCGEEFSVSIQKEFFAEDSRKQRSPKSKKVANCIDQEDGQNNLSDGYATNGIWYNDSCFIQNVSKEHALQNSSCKYASVDKAVLKQESEDMEMLRLQSERHSLDRNNKKFSSGQVQKRTRASGFIGKSLQRCDVIKNEQDATLETEVSEQQYFQNSRKSPVVTSRSNEASNLDNFMTCDANGVTYDTAMDADNYVNPSMFCETGMTFNADQPIILSPDYGPEYKPVSTTSFQFHPRPNRTYSRPSNIWKKSHRYQQNSLTMMKSFHICGYPGCGKQFHHRRHLLRHQTQKHGRIPTRMFNSGKRTSWHIRDFVDPWSSSVIN